MPEVSWPYWPSATVALAHPGLQIAERYLLIEQIGVGAMGAVWRATDQRLNRQVALKQVVLAPGLDLRQATEARQRILREGRISARLQHPHSVAIYDVCMHDGEPWLVMEYLRARSLADILTMDGLLSDRTAARIGAQLADALDAAHQAGIVHRDVKPGNVLVCAGGTVKLSDFGIARAAGDITVTQTGVLTGTPDYFAPEVARGAAPTPEGDMFSLGATLYISVEGEPPFGTHTNALAKMHMVAAGKIRPPRQAGRLGPVLQRLMDADPTRRPTASQARALLLDAERGVTTSAQVPRPRRAERTGGSHAADARPAARLSGVLPPTPGPRRPVNRRRLKFRLLAGIAVLTCIVATALALSHTRGNTPTSASPPTGVTATAEVEPTEASLATPVRQYYAQLPTHPTAAWNQLSATAHGELGGAIAFTRYWHGMRSVKLVSAQVSVPTRSVRAQLHVQTKSGQVHTTTQRLVLARQPNGQWQIDGFTG